MVFRVKFSTYLAIIGKNFNNLTKIFAHREFFNSKNQILNLLSEYVIIILFNLN